MAWFAIALCAPLLWAVGNHIDKYLLSTRLQGQSIGTLLLFSSLVGLLILPVIWLLQPQVLAITPLHAVLIVSNGMLYVLGLVPYLQALQKDEASIVVPLFQTSAVFSYLLGFVVLGERLSRLETIAALLVVGGAIVLSLEIDQGPWRIKGEVLWLMLLASFLNAFNWLLFKFVAIQGDFWVTSFWEYVGFIIVGTLMLLLVATYRAEFVALLRSSRVPILSLVTANEGLNIVAKTATNVASLLAPLALVSAVNAFQPLFVLAIGLVLTRHWPQLGRERLGVVALSQKFVAIFLMIVGGCLLAVK
jgi:drug/metabolite transporter (DMT)-like permease